MEKVECLSQHEPDAEAFLHWQPVPFGARPHIGQITGSVRQGSLLPARVEGVAQFHHIIEITGGFLRADKVNAQQSVMLV